MPQILFQEHDEIHLNTSVEMIIDEEHEMFQLKPQPQLQLQLEEQGGAGGLCACACASDKALRPFVIISSSYLLFTITDGAIRMIVLLHAYNKGFSALEVAIMFSLYELAGVFTNLAAGLMGARWGIKLTLICGKFVCVECDIGDVDGWGLFVCLFVWLFGWLVGLNLYVYFCYCRVSDYERCNV